jgi:anti-sigma regulatory factor (Ser/Thr protein kinase)
MPFTPWDEQAPPTPTDSPRAVWHWALASPLDVTASRMQLRTTLDTWSGYLPDRAEPDDIDRLLLAYEELASNGLRHGAPPVAVQVTGTASGWLIDVTDAAPEHGPSPAVDRDPADGGLGLYLIADLATACGWSIDAGRKHVWASIKPA